MVQAEEAHRVMGEVVKAIKFKDITKCINKIEDGKFNICKSTPYFDTVKLDIILDDDTSVQLSINPGKVGKIISIENIVCDLAFIMTGEYKLQERKYITKVLDEVRGETVQISDIERVLGCIFKGHRGIDLLNGLKIAEGALVIELVDDFNIANEDEYRLYRRVLMSFFGYDMKYFEDIELIKKRLYDGNYNLIKNDLKGPTDILVDGKYRFRFFLKDGRFQSYIIMGSDSEYVLDSVLTNRLIERLDGLFTDKIHG